MQIIKYIYRGKNATGIAFQNFLKSVLSGAYASTNPVGRFLYIWDKKAFPIRIGVI